MAKRDGSWLLSLEHEGRTITVSTDDLTLDELDTAERACGLAWPFMNPRRSARAGKALLAVLLIRDGVPEDKALEEAGRVTLAQLADAFTWVAPTDPLPAGEGAGGDPEA